MSRHVNWRARASSTKLHLALFAMALISGAYAFTGFNEHAFDGFVMGILGAAAVYTGGNVAEKRGAASAVAESLPPPPDKTL